MSAPAATAEPATADADGACFDIAIVGAGIVGAAVAYGCAAHVRVLWLEAEAAPGMHSTGRSAALYAPAYGPPQVRALTRASRNFFEHPPAGFANVPLLRARPTWFVADEAGCGALQALQAQLRAEGLDARLIDGAQAQRQVPVLRPEACAQVLIDPSSSDIDVDALLQGFVRGARVAGAQVVTQARLVGLQRSGGLWHLATTGRQGPWRARCIVNAAGAWADELAALAGATPVGLQPRRRSAFTFEPPPGLATNDWPALVAADESWYLKPDAGLLLGSPANADPVHPHDVVAEELDIASGIHRIETATTLQIRRPRSTWAGLRSFVADGEPVCGFDPRVPGLFWAAALGGYGIQSSPAVGRLCSAWLRHALADPTAAFAATALPPEVGAAAPGVDLAALSPARFAPG